MSDGVPEIVPAYVGFAPVVDGKVGDQAWSLAASADGFHLLGSAGPATQQTSVRVCYDRKNLYFMFECMEDRMSDLVLKYADDHSPVWQDDSVELFICPYAAAGQSRCHQFVVNAAGAKTYLRPGWLNGNLEWRAAVSRMSDRWIAEIAVAYDTLRPLGKNECCWRINFGRNEHPHEETSSWAPVPKWFRTYSLFGRMLPPQAPYQFITFRGDLALLKSDTAAEAGAKPVEGPVKALDSSEFIVPEPQERHMRASRPDFRITPATRLVLPDEPDEADMWTADEINSAIESMGGTPLQIVRAFSVSPNPDVICDAIVVGGSGRNSLSRIICDAEGIHLPRSRFGTGSHVVDVTQSRIVLAGQSQVDTYYAVQTLKQLMRVADDGGIRVASQLIRDYPRFAFRGAHLLASKDALSFLGKLIENVLAPLKVNHIVLQTDKVEWKSHPEVTDPSNCMSQEDVKKLLEIARRHHIQVTPLVQSPGHLEWAFRNGANLDIAEDPNVPYCYCMSNPRSYDFIFDIMDEAIELFGQPEYFHAGRDEFDMRGELPVDDKCRAIGKERLYIEDTLKVYQHLKDKGCKMMMWGDVLLKQGYREMVDELPKDIIINDWHYGPSEAYPSIDFYQQHGFPVLGCTWYDPRNVATFSIYGGKRGIDGMLQTTWTGFLPEETVLAQYPEQAYAYILSAAWAWNPVRPSLDRLPYKPRVLFEKAWRRQSDGARGEFAAVDLRPYYNISRVDSGRMLGWLGVGRGNDLRKLPAGLISLGGVPYRIGPATVGAPSVVMLGGEGMADAFPRTVRGIRLDTKVSALHFLHGCAYTTDSTKVGAYVVHYADGGVQEIPLTYETNIYSWDDQSSGLSYGFAWCGRAQDGRAVGVCDLAWTNPRPDVEVTSIDFTATQTQASPFVVAITVER